MRIAQVFFISDSAKLFEGVTLDIRESLKNLGLILGYLPINVIYYHMRVWLIKLIICYNERVYAKMPCHQGSYDCVC